MPLTSLVKSILKASKNDRALLENSAIARENKLFKLKVLRDNCLLHAGDMAEYM